MNSVLDEFSARKLADIHSEIAEKVAEIDLIAVEKSFGVNEVKS